LRADEKHVRTQSAILYENNPKPLLLLTITVFSVRMCFSSVQKTKFQWRLMREARYAGTKARLARAARKSAHGMQRYLRLGI
jgi:hypothetical protein